MNNFSECECELAEWLGEVSISLEVYSYLQRSDIGEYYVSADVRKHS
jgi:hypothetical protein